ncbi:MAG: hydrolase [Verrucomicrobiales bacterium]|jgi:nicotinamidase-related amidase|nr:hydrolase [Verrucomicrobiales bacterium]
MNLLDIKRSALVLIDLQQGIVNMPVAPHSGAEVVRKSKQLAERFRAAGAPVVLVRVIFSPDGKDVLHPQVDEPMHRGPLPDNWTEFTADVSPQAGDIVITKRQWGAFYGTELDLQLRRRGINTIVLGGIATNIGVESTARAAFELGYEQVFVEDAMSSLSVEAHAFAVRTILPRIGRVRSTEQVLAAVESA